MRIIFTLLFCSILFSCKKSDNGETGQEQSTPVKDSFYFQGKLNGVDINWVVPSQKDDEQFVYRAGASFSSGLRDSCGEGYCYRMFAYSQIFKNVPNYNWPQINVGFDMASQTHGRETAITWFLPGMKNYALRRTFDPNDLYDPSKNGVNIFYIDSDGRQWATVLGDQQGSQFESILLEEGNNKNAWIIDKVWTAKFSCKLYDFAGNAITLEGKICGPLFLQFK